MSYLLAHFRPLKSAAELDLLIQTIKSQLPNAHITTDNWYEDVLEKTELKLQQLTPPSVERRAIILEDVKRASEANGPTKGLEIRQPNGGILSGPVSLVGLLLTSDMNLHKGTIDTIIECVRQFGALLDFSISN